MKIEFSYLMSNSLTVHVRLFLMGSLLGACLGNAGRSKPGT